MLFLVAALAACSDPPVVARPDTGGGPRPDAARPPGPDGARPVDAGAMSAPDAPAPDAPAAPPPDAGPATNVPAGDVMGMWCGAVTVAGNVTVPSGATLEICAGSTVSFAAMARLAVDGTLRARGSTTARIALGGPGWRGIAGAGVIDLQFTDIRGAALGIDGLPESTVTVADSTIAESTQTLRVANGARFERSTLTGGGSIALRGGVLTLVDSTVDLGHPEASPDCIVFSGGGLTLDHARVTGCHCPLHINSATAPIQIMASILDGAAYPAMVARASGTISGSHLLGSVAALQDIGGSIDLDIAGNYYGGAAPVLDSGNRAQFRNAAMFSAAPIDGVGPRI